MAKSVVSALRWAWLFLFGLACGVVPFHAAFAPPPPLILQVVHAPPLEEVVRRALLDPWTVPAVPAALITEEVLWLARIAYSESKRPNEQELVAWVARNRAETGFRGRHTIKEVAQDPYQFSALRSGTAAHRHYTGLTAASQAPGWGRALALAYYVLHADSSLRPFSPDTRHFYSERSLSHPDSLPHWALGRTTVQPDRSIQLEPRRFRFYAGVL